MKRDFTNESKINLFVRALRSFLKRLRGRTYYYCGFFTQDSSPLITFGEGARFINSKSIKLGKNVHFGLLARLECYEHGKISIGQNSSCGDYVHIGSMNQINIGNNVLIGSNVLIIDHNHGNPKVDISNKNNKPPRDREISSKGMINIEDNVWIGDGVVILSGITIGRGSIIGANTIVRENINQYTIYTGRSE